MTDHDEHARTISFAETALGQIKALKQPATPRNFEIWYTYATGHNQELNQTINETLVREGRLTEEDLSRVYNEYLSPVRFSERIDEVGTRIVGEIEQVMTMIDAAIGQSTDFSQSLAGAQQQIISSSDRDQLRFIVETLVRATKEVEQANQSLQKRLVDSREEISVLQENLETVRNESLTDPLTTLANRKFFEESIKQFVDEANGNDMPLSVILTDIDHFKKFNDTYGHLTGDQVLRLVAIALKQNVKGHDVAARYGGEEYVVLLPKTALMAAVTVADHIRRAVMGKELMRRSTGETLGRVTISLGVAAWRKGDTVATLLERADGCLYAAKRAGRNCVVAETALEPEVEAQVA
ncbi:MAG TPA: GGDEF domain-containing protein [Xanthobacteraceae bacterium]|jgi:diguanylate cyclase